MKIKHDSMLLHCFFTVSFMFYRFLTGVSAFISSPFMLLLIPADFFTASATIVFCCLI